MLLSLFIHPWTTPGKREITETALEGVAVTYPLPLSRPFFWAWMNDLIDTFDGLPRWLLASRAYHEGKHGCDEEP